MITDLIFIGGMSTFLITRASLQYVSWKLALFDIIAVSACYLLIRHQWGAS